MGVQQQQMSVERAARIKIGRVGSILERDQSVAEAVIEDISTSGCFVRGELSLAAGTLLAVGVPGIGTHAARVMRLTKDGAGCAFLIPLSADEVDAVRNAEAAELADGAAPKRVNGFVHVKDSIRSAANAAREQPSAAEPKSLAARLFGGLRKR